MHGNDTDIYYKIYKEDDPLLMIFKMGVNA